MSYTILTTNAFILHRKPHGESGVLLYLLTREHGLIHAFAQGSRNMKSKLNFHTQLFSHACFDCVRSREGWILTGADTQTETTVIPAYAGIQEQSFKESLELRARSFDGRHNNNSDHKYILNNINSRIAKIIKYFVHGECENSQDLYDWIHYVRNFCLQNPNYLQNNSYTKIIEILSIAKIIHILGYIDNTSINNLTEFSQDIFDNEIKNTRELTKQINTAIKVSDLQHTTR